MAAAATVRAALAPGDFEAAQHVFRVSMGESFSLDPALFAAACGGEGYAV